MLIDARIGRTDDGWVEVNKIEDTGRYETVCNLGVQDFQTYFVGGEGWGFGVWAHSSYGTDLTNPMSRGRPESVFADGSFVYAGNKPPRITGPDPAAGGQPHSVLRWFQGSAGQQPRVYGSREFGQGGVPIRDVDFTHPVVPGFQGYPTIAPGHEGVPLPHQHQWVPNNPANPAAGNQRGPAQAL